MARYQIETWKLELYMAQVAFSCREKNGVSRPIGGLSRSCDINISNSLWWKQKERERCINRKGSIEKEREREPSLQRRSRSRAHHIQCYLIDGIKLSKMGRAYFAWPRQQWFNSSGILRYICHCAHDRVLGVLDTETSPLLLRSYPLSLSRFRWSSFLGQRREDDTLSRRDSTEYKSRRSRIYLLCTELLIYSSRWPRKQIQIMIKISLRFH